MNEEAIKYIPHRPPFLFVNEVRTRDDGLIVGSYQFKPDEFFFAGHFPEYPVVPGVILVESLAQCGGAALVKSGDIPYKTYFFLATVREAKFRRQVLPSERIDFEIKTVRLSSKMLRQRGKGYVDGVLSTEADWMCIMKGSEEETE